MDYKELEKVNKELKTTDVKGKDYVEVNERVKAFRMLFPNGIIGTEIVEMQDGIVTIKATIADNEGHILATGHAQEKEGSSFINKTSYIENCETSAVGRALGMLGIGIDTSIASSDEVVNAINNQTISLTLAKSLKQACENKKYSNDFVSGVLNKYGYTKLSEIKQNDYNDIVKELEKGC